MKTKSHLSISRKAFIKALFVGILLTLTQFTGAIAQNLPYARIDYYYNASRSTETGYNDHYRIYEGKVTFWEDASCSIPWTGSVPATVNFDMMSRTVDYHGTSESVYSGGLAIEPWHFEYYPYVYYGDKLTQPTNSQPYYYESSLWYKMIAGDGYIVADNQAF